jgi:hypothetical protein
MSIPAFNLTQRPPRSPYSRLGGLVILPRMLDKARATAVGENGEYHYDCPIDQHLLKFLGLDPAALLEEVRAGRGDAELLTWIMGNAKIKREPWEIEAWSAYQEKRAPGSDQETATFFTGRLGEMGASTRDDVKTWFDLLELDDYVTFGGKA